MKTQFSSLAPFATITATTQSPGTIPGGNDNQMIHRYLLLHIIIALTLPSAANAGEPISQLKADGPSPGRALAWNQAAPSPFARVESPAAVVKGRVYLFGGFSDDLNASTRVDVYDPATDAWSRKKDMPAGLTHLNAVVDGGHIWFAGGFKGKHPGAATDEVWKYEIASDTWAPGPPLPEPRAGGGLAVAEHRLHYFGGLLTDRNTNAGDHWSLAIGGEKNWQREPNLPDPRGHLGATALEGKIYALGGQHGHDVKQVDVSSCHRFDPKTRQWSAIASLPDGRSHFESSTIIHEGRILIVGGRCNSSLPPRNVVGDILQYDPRTDRWLVVGEMPEKLMAPAVALVSGRLIVTGGGLDNPRPLTAATRIAMFPPGE
jgi:Kelch motif